MYARSLLLLVILVGSCTQHSCYNIITLYRYDERIKHSNAHDMRARYINYYHSVLSILK